MVHIFLNFPRSQYRQHSPTITEPPKLYSCGFPGIVYISGGAILRHSKLSCGAETMSLNWAVQPAPEDYSSCLGSPYTAPGISKKVRIIIWNPTTPISLCGIRQSQISSVKTYRSIILLIFFKTVWMYMFVSYVNKIASFSWRCGVFVNVPLHLQLLKKYWDDHPLFFVGALCRCPKQWDASWPLFKK